MTDTEWARAFVSCKIEGTGIRFNETVDVLVRKFAQVRQEAVGRFRASGPASGRQDDPEPLHRPVA